ncbi:hypothetical protein RFI_01409 [Reticulomyxa filosa]|uniref:Uncharacterized protein n=1 Tax=Reticulomyxa filosa TaxID=46433 RepID=X6PC10_RETFI|nr:hypothetical protein RFI_01409 [Reticulomyxa filosa]|eukprot:ETO35653.1 hypothetical protein RFI_01409 [Reticulomyxa filosa]
MQIRLFGCKSKIKYSQAIFIVSAITLVVLVQSHDLTKNHSSTFNHHLTDLFATSYNTKKINHTKLRQLNNSQETENISTSTDLNASINTSINVSANAKSDGNRLELAIADTVNIKGITIEIIGTVVSSVIQYHTKIKMERMNNVNDDNQNDNYNSNNNLLNIEMQTKDWTTEIDIHLDHKSKSIKYQSANKPFMYILVKLSFSLSREHEYICKKHKLKLKKICIIYCSIAIAWIHFNKDKDLDENSVILTMLYKFLII